MKIGVHGRGWWKDACDVLGHEVVELPIAEHSSGNSYAADEESRTANGAKVREILAQQPVDLLLDNGGAGLAFQRRPDDERDVRLSHEVAQRVLCSHFIDPVVAAFQGLNWGTAWRTMQSTSWVKAVWDRAQTLELQKFEIPHVIHVPMAAPDRKYDTAPLDPGKIQPVVSFVGGQNTTFFTSAHPAPTDKLLRGALAHAVRSDLPTVTFYGIYHDLYGFAEPPKDDDDIDTKLRKMFAYFHAKVFYNASLCIRNRDRFVMFLARHLRDRFHLVGRDWDKAYGIQALPQFQSDDEYFGHFREAAINLNLVNGNAETGLNMRHFEITAAGGFMLCYKHPELAENFEIGRECAVFNDESDLLDKIEYYLANEDERLAIARAGQRRTLSQHLYSHRLRGLLALLEKAGALDDPPQSAHAVDKVGSSFP